MVYLYIYKYHKSYIIYHIIYIIVTVMGVKTNIYLEGHHLVNIMDGLNVKRNSKKHPNI